jgi:hypothetical protein
MGGIGVSVARLGIGYYQDKRTARRLSFWSGGFRYFRCGKSEREERRLGCGGTLPRDSLRRMF